RWVAWVFRMIKDGNANRLVIHGPVVITPFRGYAPGLAVAHAGALHDVALAGLVFAVNHPHRLSDADGERTLLRIAEDDILVSSLQSHIKIKKPFVGRSCVNSKGALISANDRPVRRNPVVGGLDDAGVGAGFDVEEFVVK